jgi:hypothetical protein
VSDPTEIIQIRPHPTPLESPGKMNSLTKMMVNYLFFDEEDDDEPFAFDEQDDGEPFVFDEQDDDELFVFDNVEVDIDII